MNILKYFSDIFKTKRADLLKTPFLKSVIKVLSDLIFFILKLQNTEGKDALEVDGIPPFCR
jgi:hypothetical protein